VRLQYQGLIDQAVQNEQAITPEIPSFVVLAQKEGSTGTAEVRLYLPKVRGMFRTRLAFQHVHFIPIGPITATMPYPSVHSLSKGSPYSTPLANAKETPSNAIDNIHHDWSLFQ
jgi:hypothetical protein